MSDPDAATTPSRYGCSRPDCDRHPSKGDTILRTSPKGQPFAGRCAEHLDVSDPDPATNLPVHPLSDFGRLSYRERLIVAAALADAHLVPDTLMAEAIRDERQRWAEGLGGVHRIEGGGEYCTEDGFHWPCRTARKVADLLDGDRDE